ncbi:MAG: CBS domain-containing protein [Anaerolineae bacterium]
MRSGFRIGKIFGINVRIDWSWLVIFFLTSWNLAAELANLHGTWSPVLRWGLAISGSLLFFLSVLAHELAHSLVAQSRGMNVRSIRLHLFGGVSNIQREPDSPGAEFVMAILGPVTSLVIGGALLLVIGLTTQVGALDSPREALRQLNPAVTILAWLGSVNLILGVFNLIPGFPLDGGRVLRSIIWAITGNLRVATRWASWTGQGIAWLMIFGGIASVFGVSVPLVGGGGISGLWLAFIGWFLHNAAVQSYRQLVVRDALDDVPVSEVMRKNPPTISPDQTVATLVQDYIMQTDDYGFPVVEEEHLVGIVTLEDVRSISRQEWDITSVREIMTPEEDLVTMTPDDSAATALEQLAGRDVRQLPVLQDENLVGLVRRRDIVKWLRLQSDSDIGGLQATRSRV